MLKTSFLLTAIYTIIVKPVVGTWIDHRKIESNLQKLSKYSGTRLIRTPRGHAKDNVRNTCSIVIKTKETVSRTKDRYKCVERQSNGVVVLVWKYQWCLHF